MPFLYRVVYFCFDVLHDKKQYGDVSEADFERFRGFGIVMGGSPCQAWSIAKANREVDKSGVGWKLFMRFAEAVRTVRPRWFLYENVASMPRSIRAYISEELGVEPVMINSALVSAQHRKRLYWTNIPDISQPGDKGILLKDILESGMAYQDKSYCMTASYDGAAFRNSLERKQRSMAAEPVAAEVVGAALRTREDAAGRFKRLEVRSDGKLNALTTVQTDSVICTPVRIGQFAGGGQGSRIYSVRGKSVCISAGSGGWGRNTGLYKVDLPDGDYVIRKLTPTETERCQTLPDGYTAFGINEKGETVPMSNTQRYKCIGNGWTVDVIAHILRHIPW